MEVSGLRVAEILTSSYEDRGAARDYVFMGDYYRCIIRGLLYEGICDIKFG